MRCILILLLFISACAGQKAATGQSDSPSQKYKVSGTIMQKSSYCGGARPSPAMLKKIKSPKPLANYKIYVQRGTEYTSTDLLIDSTMTSENGTYSFSLPSGEYLLLSKAQVDKTYLTEITDREFIKITDQTCLDEWCKNGLKQFTLKDQDLMNVDYLSNKKCDIPDGIPCVKYTGPKRP